MDDTSPPPTSSLPPGRDGSKVRRAYRSLEAMARALGPGGRLPTVRQLQVDLGVSLATLNSALLELEERDIVQRRHGSGVYVTERALHRRFCLICSPDHLVSVGASPFWAALINAARRRAVQHLETLTLHFLRLDAPAPSGEMDSSPLEAGLADDIAKGRIDGVLAIKIPEAVTYWIEAQGVPAVAVAGAAHYMVGLAPDEIISGGVRALAERGLRRLALWRTPENPFQPQFSQVFRQTAARCGVETLADDIVIEQTEGGLAQEAYHKMRQLLEGGGQGLPDGLVSTDEMLTQGLALALAERGLRIGRDVAVATHANAGSPTLLGLRDSVILLEMDTAEIIDSMFSALEAVLAGQEPEGFQPFTPINPADRQRTHSLKVTHPHLRMPSLKK